MKIVADENIPYVRDAFGGLGDVTTLPGRAISRELVRAADVLLVRSITRVGRELIEGSRVRFVGTATIGEDHVDTAWLAEHGVSFASAPGSNAGSVTQYVSAALLALEARLGLDLRGMKLGVVGVGNVGSGVVMAARALGMEVVLNDPPLERALKLKPQEAQESQDEKWDTPHKAPWEGRRGASQTGEDFRPVEEIFGCDVVTLHVPLTRQGPDRTYHLVDARFFSRLQAGTILINTSRGSVVDGVDLKEALDSGRLAACVLDVWEGEPDIDVSLLERVFVGTPHIAGYSFDGKVNGTRMIYEAACRFLGRAADWDPTPLLPAPERPRVEVDGTAQSALNSTVRAVYDIMEDDAAMRGLISAASGERARFFDRLRKEYPRRREFFNTTAVVRPQNIDIEARLSGLGFRVEV
ncbi:MAG TPA: 4-phosphoerythronate dehydrogenase [Candidatus Bathyarchaeia archaeon]|nr:4-phosphoerythronate dehydrogenase [Candidatus Bathyarchaeia archaeon]